MSVDNHIISYLKLHGEGSINDLTENIRVSRQTIHKAVKRLVQENYLFKLGTSPKVFYKIPKASNRWSLINCITAIFMQLEDSGKLHWA